MNFNEAIDTLIFTDLDGTLLDHHTYSFEPAAEMLHYIATHPVMLIIVTSKTETEVKKLQQSLGIYLPAIVENGAGILLPAQDGNYTSLPLSKPYAEIRKAFTSYQQTIAMQGFGDMTPEEVSAHTGLPPAQSTDAKQRDYTEPFILQDEVQLEKLRALAAADGLEIVKGGRFYHLITAGQDKAAAIRYFTEQFETKPETVALGDGPNDITMLLEVDTPVLIPKYDGSYIPCKVPNLNKALYPGPKGWNLALKEYFNA